MKKCMNGIIIGFKHDLGNAGALCLLCLEHPAVHRACTADVQQPNFERLKCVAVQS